MKTLYLLRHAHAENAADDHARPLSARGLLEAASLASFVQTENITPDYILSSSATRTLQTAQAAFAKKAAADRTLYLAPATRLMQCVMDTEDTVKGLMIIAHNPGIAELAHYFAPEKSPDFSPATLAVFTADITKWEDFVPETAKLAKIFVPHA